MIINISVLMFFGISAAENRQVLSEDDAPHIFSTIFPPDVSEFDIDCKKARNKAQRIICNQDSDPLQKLVASQDKIMRTELQWALMRSNDKDKVLESHREWINLIRDSCIDGRCMTDAHELRMAELRLITKPLGNCYTLFLPLMHKGGGIKPIEPICQIMEKNLNQYCEQPPMACEIKISPIFNEKVALPNWRPVEESVNLSDFKKSLRTSVKHKKMKMEDEEGLLENLNRNLVVTDAEKKISITMAKLDIYNLGEVKAAYRVDYGNCDAVNPRLTNKVEWDAVIKSDPVQIQYMPNIMQSLHEKYYFLGGDIIAGDVFLYGGKTYSYYMQGHEASGENWFVINRHEGLDIKLQQKPTIKMNNICFFKYHPLTEVEKCTNQWGRTNQCNQWGRTR